MKLLAYCLILPLALGEQLVIPAVQSVVADQLAKYAAYAAYQGPTGPAAAAAAPHANANAIAAPADANAAPAVSNPYPYWYEAIAHQGKAAFNPNTAYTVFRNVKSYGAKG